MKIKKKLVLKEKVIYKILMIFIVLSTLILILVVFSDLSVPEKYNECINNGNTREYCENNIR